MRSVRFAIIGLFALLVAAGAQAQSPQIITVAGGGPPNGAVATQVGLDLPTAVADNHGNIFTTAGNNVYEVNLSTSKITLIAGNSSATLAGDGGPATSASLNGPLGLALDSSGNLFIADTVNNRVREVICADSSIACTPASGTVAGEILSVVGGGNPGLNSPDAVAIDPAGNIFIADTGSNRILRHTPSQLSGFSVFAGTGTAGFTGDGGPATSAELNSPNGVALDASGNVFIADSMNNRVREVSGGKINTVAGNGVQCVPATAACGDGGAATSAQLSFPQGVFVDTSSNLFIADSEDNRIRKVTAGTITTVVGTGALCLPTNAPCGDGGAATSAALNFSSFVFVDTSGNIFISDNPISRIREVIAGTINTIAGNGTPGLCSTSASGCGPATLNSEFASPEGVAVDSSGNLYIADTFDNVVREVFCVFNSGPGGCSPPAGHSVGDIVVFAGNGLFGFSGDGGPATSAELNTPDGVAVDSAGNVFIADGGNNVIRQVTASSGKISTVAGNGTACTNPTANPACGDTGAATSAQLNFPGGISVDASGNLFIADLLDNRVREVFCIDSSVTCTPPPGGSAGEIVTVAGNGTTCPDPTTACGDGGAATSAQLSTPEDAFVDSSGNIFIADTFNNKIRKVTAGTISTVAGTGTAGTGGIGGPATSAQLSTPEGVAVDAVGNIFIADSDSNATLEVLKSAGTLTSVSGTGKVRPGFTGDGGRALPAKMNFPDALVIDPFAGAYIADTLNDRVRLISLTASPTGLPFGNWIVNTTSSPLSETLTNTGLTPLTVSSIVFGSTSPGDFSETDNCIGAAIASGLSCTVNVKFTPGATGIRDGNMTFTDNLNGVAGSTQTISLVGGGVDFALTASPFTQTVTRPNSTMYTIAVFPRFTFNQTVFLSCSGLPANTTCSFAPPSVTLDGVHPSDSTLTLQTTNTTPTGSFNFQAVGTFTAPTGTVTMRTVTLTVKVQ